MNKHRIGALVAAAALTLTFAGTAFANDLHQDTPIVGTSFNEPMDCSEGWHFIHTDTDGSDLPSELTATFKDAGTVKVAGYSNGGGNAVVMYDVLVDPSDTLESASDDISNGGLLNLSHVCWTQTTTTTTSDETTTTKQTTTTSDTTTSDTTTTDQITTTSDTTTSDETTTSDTTTTDQVTTSTTSNETTPEGSVEELTPPSTDTIGQPTSSSTVSTSLLLVLAGMFSAALVLVPAAARKRR